MMIKLNRMLKRPTLYIITSVLALGLPVLLHTVSAGRADPGILQPEDLPAGAIVMTPGFPSSDKIGHPLSSESTSSLRAQLSSEEQSLLSGYKAMRRFAALLPTQGVVVMNFAYEYATATEAEQAAQVLQAHIRGAATLLQVKDFKETKGLRGHEFLLQGDEGDSVCWFVGSRDKRLVLLMVNGMEQSSVLSVFEMMVQKLMNK